jgi:hypothetical protein
VSTDPGTEVDIKVKAPAVTHTIKLNRVCAWVNGVAKSPKDKMLKDRLKECFQRFPKLRKNRLQTSRRACSIRKERKY